MKMEEYPAQIVVIIKFVSVSCRRLNLASGFVYQDVRCRMCLRTVYVLSVLDEALQRQGWPAGDKAIPFVPAPDPRQSHRARPRANIPVSREIPVNPLASRASTSRLPFAARFPPVPQVGQRPFSDDILYALQKQYPTIHPGLIENFLRSSSRSGGADHDDLMEDPLEGGAPAPGAGDPPTPPIPDSPTPSMRRRSASIPFSELEFPPLSDRPSSPEDVQSSGSSHVSAEQGEGSTTKRSSRKRSREEVVANPEEPEAEPSKRSRTSSGRLPSLKLFGKRRMQGT